MALIRKVLRYVAGTIHYHLSYPRAVQRTLDSVHAHIDGDWGGCKETRKSTSGWIIAINGTSFVSITRKRTIIAVSSGESEYYTLFGCVKQLNWKCKIFWEISHKKPLLNNEIKFEAAKVYTDSQVAPALAMNKQASIRTKYLDLKYHFFKHGIEISDVVL